MNVEHAIEELLVGCSRYLGEERFYELLDIVRADAIRDAASGLVDWDIMYGHEPETSVSKVSHANSAYLMRVADDFERGGH